MSTVDTPDCTTIAAVGELLSLPESQCVKTMLVRGEEGPIAVVLRGDVSGERDRALQEPQVPGRDRTREQDVVVIDARHFDVLVGVKEPR